MRAQMFHDRKQKVTRANMDADQLNKAVPVDYLNPVGANTRPLFSST